MSRHRIFSPSQKKNYAKLYGGGKSQIRSDGPIIIYPGTDSLPNILSSIPDKIVNKFQLNDVTKGHFQNWMIMANEVFPKCDSITEQHEINNKSDYFNSEVDRVRSQALERNRRLIARFG
jgi:hypothetical protein